MVKIVKNTHPKKQPYSRKITKFITKKKSIKILYLILINRIDCSNILKSPQAYIIFNHQFSKSPARSWKLCYMPDTEVAFSLLYPPVSHFLKCIWNLPIQDSKA